MSRKEPEVILAGKLDRRELEKVARIYANLISNEKNGLKLSRKQRIQVAKSMKEKM